MPLLRWITSILLLAALATAGCKSTIAKEIVEAPNDGKPKAVPLPDARRGMTVREFSYTVGNPPVLLFGWLLDPLTPPRGTIVVMHGYLRDRRQVAKFAVPLVEAGYRVVLPDLRGHGATGGKYIGFGALEATDIAQVLYNLDQQGLLTRPVGAWGLSNGAVTALLLPSRGVPLDAIVSVSAYTSMLEQVPRFSKNAVPLFGKVVSKGATRRAVEKAGFKVEQADALAHMGAVKAPVRFIHGEDDGIVPPDESRKLLAKAPPGSDLVLVPNEGHQSIEKDESGKVRALTVEWFNRHLGRPARPRGDIIGRPRR